MSTDDPFRPRQQPHREIYDAFQAEAAKRKGRSFDEWNAAEIRAVHAAATAAAPVYGLNAPTIEQVERAQTYAMGSVDYGATWAAALVDRMRAKAV